MAQMLEEDFDAPEPIPEIDHEEEAALKETCILVNTNDRPIGSATIRDCHSFGENGNLKLHRSFTVFVFNGKGQVLFTKRSPKKTIFPNTFFVTTSGHPSYDVPGEDEEKDALGVRRAAKRRLGVELGVPEEEIDISSMKYITRFYYKSLANEQWGEHEIAYVLFYHQNVSLNPNFHEITDLIYVKDEELKMYVDKLKHLKQSFTPFGTHVLINKLPVWWQSLNNVQNIQDHEKIYTLKRGKSPPEYVPLKY